MLGERGPQRGLFEADALYLDYVGRGTFYAFLSAERGQLFRDEDFAGLYSATRGRPSVAPSLLATALVLQWHDRVSDEEARRRAAYDLQWKVALGVPLQDRPFAKSTLQEFRAQLVVHAEQGAIFRRSLDLAKRRGRLKGKLRLVLDTTNILGRGAVKDTYNLLADGIVLVLRALGGLAGEAVAETAERLGYGRYVQSPSLKGQAAINWDDAGERRRFLAAIVTDADRLLEDVRATRGQLVADSLVDRALADAAGLLSRVLQQDIERREDGPALREGVAKDRMPSVHDPQMRHGRKSKAKRFDGHKLQLAVDTESQVITGVAVLAGNAPDKEGALAVVEASEALTGCAVEETIGDCAYGDGATRRQFADAKRTLIAKVPAVRNQGRFPKTRFQIDLAARSCTCPAGRVSRDLRPRKEGGGVFRFAAAVCVACPLRPECVRGRGGRSVQLHPEEALLQEARAFQQSTAFAPYRARRQVVEHRLARLSQLGIRQARYRGVAKTLFQAFMVAAVANLTLLAAGAGPNWRLLSLIAWLRALVMARRAHPAAIQALSGIQALAERLPRLLASHPQANFKMADSRPDF
jgi:transposase